MMDTMAREVARRIKSPGDNNTVLVVCHYDADGISSGAIAMESLKREGITPRIEIVEGLDDATIERIHDIYASDGIDLVWFTDLGSGVLSKIMDMPVVVSDHHILDHNFLDKIIEPTENIVEFVDSASPERILELIPIINPHVIGESGDTDISGSTAKYFVARALNRDNRDLAHLAVVGSVGDMMDVHTGRLEKYNREALMDAVAEGSVEIIRDLKGFGWSTWDVVNYITYNDIVPEGLKKDRARTVEFISLLGIDPAKKWYQLNPDEKRRIISYLVQHHITANDFDDVVMEINRILGEVYILTGEEDGGPLKEAREFARVLNSCGRHGYGISGVYVCLGDRDEHYAVAIKAIDEHRNEVRKGIVKASEVLIKGDFPHIQYFIGGDEIHDGVVGTVAGSVLASPEADQDKVIVGMAHTRDGTGIKVSARASQLLVEDGVDLNEAVGRAAEKVGGAGGGHNAAAGATIPLGTEMEFLKELEMEIEKQIKNKNE